MCDAKISLFLVLPRNCRYDLMAFIPVKINGSEIHVENEVEELTFKELNLKECHLEEFIRNNIGTLFADEEENLLIVGQQVIDEVGSRSDLVAIDGNGCLVLIEVKRDLQDMKSRSEALESQAIRYAASLAKINDPRDLVEKMFASYIDKHKNEEPYKSKLVELSSYELATRELNAFLGKNDLKLGFNNKQRIILIASEFDRTTLSSSAWLIKNGVDFSCYELQPIKSSPKTFLDFRKVLPLEKEEDYFIDIIASLMKEDFSESVKTRAKRRSLPRMATLFEWNLLKSGDRLHIKNFPDSEVVVEDHRTVKFRGKNISFNEWGETVTGWSSICIYEWAVLEPINKTLHELRLAKLAEIEKTESKVA